jgi:nucleoside-diphosphate-sugar epimerase
MNILITGAFGFVGTNLSRALAASGKHRLIAPDLTEPFQLVAQSPPAEFYRHYSEFVSRDELHTLGKKKTAPIRKKNFDTVSNIIAVNFYNNENLNHHRHLQQRHPHFRLPGIG